MIDINKLHTTALGEERICHNLRLIDINPVDYCRTLILDPSSIITRSGKNFYVTCGAVRITINASSYTIITAHIEKNTD